MSIGVGVGVENVNIENISGRHIFDLLILRKKGRLKRQ